MLHRALISNVKEWSQGRRLVPVWDSALFSVYLSPALIYTTGV